MSIARRRTTGLYPWVKLDDEALLNLRLCDLKLRFDQSPMVARMEELYAELNGRGISFRP